jgi:hypothetical protein
MPRESDLLAWLDPELYLVVEKATNLVWTCDDLRQACRRGDFQQPDQLVPLSGFMSISGPYPGCLQLPGASAKHLQHTLFAQTQHFVVFLQEASMGRFS